MHIFFLLASLTIVRDFIIDIILLLNLDRIKLFYLSRNNFVFYHKFHNNFFSSCFNINVKFPHNFEFKQKRVSIFNLFKYLLSLYALLESVAKIL